MHRLSWKTGSVRHTPKSNTPSQSQLLEITQCVAKLLFCRPQPLRAGAWAVMIHNLDPYWIFESRRRSSPTISLCTISRYPSFLPGRGEYNDHRLAI